MRRNILIANIWMHSPVERKFVDEIVDPLMPACDRVYLIAGNYVRKRHDEKITMIELMPSRFHKKGNLAERVLDNLASQFGIITDMARIRNEIDCVFFNVGEYRNLPSIIAAKLLGKKTLVFHHGGNKFLEAKLNYNSGYWKLVPYLLLSVLRVSYSVADYVLCLSPAIVKFGGLYAYKGKILYFKSYVDTNTFKPILPYEGRANVVGYCGRLDPKKGLLNLAEAAQLIARKTPDARIIIHGVGQEESLLRETIEAHRLSELVHLGGWLAENEFLEFLNEIRVFVLPSSEEGVPATLLKAMACGAITVATPVGGIPDIIRDGYNGFVIQNSRPETIAECVTGILKGTDSSIISKRGRELIEREYSYDAVARQWERILAQARC